MIIGVLSDTHEDRPGALPHVIKEFQNRDVEIIVHCGDIDAVHLDAKLFGNIPVVCALNGDQIEDPAFCTPPLGWIFTRPKDRIVTLKTKNESVRCYVGHKLSFDFMTGAESEFSKRLDEIRKNNDGIRYVFAGHVHHQIYFQSQYKLTFVNPGAVADALYGHHEFAVIDTNKKGGDEIIFGRILNTKPIEKAFSVGVLSDSLKISTFDVNYWKKLAVEFHERDVSTIIHCGNLAEEDIGKSELKDFEVHYFLRNNQTNPNRVPKNWHLIDPVNSLVDVHGYQFLIQPDLTTVLMDKNEFGVRRYIESLRKDIPSIDFILCGGTQDALFIEQYTRILNPGNVIKSRRFSVVCLPRGEITIGYVPTDPL